MKNLRLLPFYTLITLLTLLISPFRGVSQIMSDDIEESQLAIDLHLKNMHLWHGQVVTPGSMTAVSIEYTSKNRNFIVGLWGGSNFSGDYTEFTYYTGYRFDNGFYTQLTSHNNYSGVEFPDIFSYDKYTSPNFLSWTLGYKAPDNFPIDIYYNTILFGNGQDFEINDDESDTNSYSMYLEFGYPVYSRGKTSARVFVAGAFSFFTKKTFYSDETNIVNIGLTVEQEFTILSKDFPVAATGFWNPATGIGALQIDITLF